MKPWIVLVAVAAAFGIAWAQEAPAGLERLLRGAVPGISEQGFRAAHPSAQALEVPVAEQDAPAPDNEVTMMESMEKDPLLGLECHANFGFREGKLREFVVLWGGPQEKVREVVRKFFQACAAKHGKGFRRDVLQINQQSDKPRMVPVLVWETAEGTYLASLAWNPESERAPGTLSYSLYAPGDPFVDIVLLGDELAPEVVRDVFAEIEPALKEIEVKG